MSGQHSPQLISEVNKLLNKGIVINTVHQGRKLISSIFLRSKPNGINQVVLNPKTITKLWNRITLK